MRNLKLLLKDDHVIGLTDVDFERDRVCSVHVLPGSKKGRLTLPRVSSPLVGPWSSFTWISLGLPTMILLVGKDLVL